jgi:predicted ArsR family transcriptional regulator
LTAWRQKGIDKSGLVAYTWHEHFGLLGIFDMLTARQREFLQKLVAMCRGARRAVHYSALAAELGVSKWSAYGMLRALERKGLVDRWYALRRRRLGSSGRSSILFGPTQQGRLALALASGAQAAGREWEAARRKVLQVLRAGENRGHVRAVHTLLRSIPQRRSPLAYCAEVIAARLLAARDSPLLERVQRYEAACASRLRSLDEAGQKALLELLGRIFGDSGTREVTRRRTRTM